jgi:putative deaminase of polymorphic toxin system
LSFDQPSQFARDELQKFVDRGLSLDGFKYFAAAANLQVDNIKSFRSGRADMSDINVDDLIGIGLLVKEGTKLLVNGIKSYGNSLAKDIGRKNIDWIRKQHVIGGKKNIALLGGEVEGQPIFGIGVSGATYREGMVGLPVFRNFAWRVIKHPRNYDSEIKLLEEFARRFHKTPNIKGRLGIISELPICESCSGVIRQFNKMFPNIEVYTINGVK